MTSHEEILVRLVAGGPVPLETAQHPEACAECRAELAALRATETALRRARPTLSAVVPPPVARVVRHRPERRWLAFAAAFALALGLTGGFWAGRSAPVPAAPERPQAQATFLAADDSTFSLLAAAGTLAEDEPSTEEVADYFETHWGG
jgi:anti-sigma factor RsiW